MTKLQYKKIGQQMKISEILKDSNYKLTQFKDEYIKKLEELKLLVAFAD
ncbi:hypothetical protein MNB_SM-7-355 [hydrothermal vent metagenome]|uniref:Uncharacterized protein n=1 Tax=hydrothermal vent metagenome TaxID=652676 RepID=A0A1W1BRD2_9ZZZZ